MLLALATFYGCTSHTSTTAQPATQFRADSLPMKYTKVEPANDLGYAKVSMGDAETYAEGIIDSKGNEVIAPRTDMLVNDITGAQALVQVVREFLFVDLDQGLVDAALLGSEKGYQYAEPFRCGRAMVQVNDRYFYIDTNGQELFGKDYDFAETFHGDRAMVKEGDHYRIIDTDGNTVAAMHYDQVNPYTPTRWQVTKIKGDVYLSGFVDLQGKEVVPLVYTEIGMWQPEVERTRVEIGERIGYLDGLGNVAIPLVYDYAEIFSKGKARVRLNGRVFFIDPAGKEVAE